MPAPNGAGKPTTGCPNAAQGLRLAVKDLGGPRYLPIRCGRRDCRYCGWLRALEDATTIYLDAVEQQPTLAITLTTHQPWEELDPEVYRRASEAVLKALRRRWGRVEWVGCIEFTTGRARRSGGRRRMHGHYLVKGIDGDQVLAVEAVVRDVWARRTGAYVIDVAELRSAGGAIAYMALHHRKPEQRPPDGWRGMTLRATKGYWHRPVPELRELARTRLAERAAAHRMRAAGIEGEDFIAIAAAAEVQLQREAIAEHGVELVKVREAPVPGGVLVPLGPVLRKPIREAEGSAGESEAVSGAGIRPSATPDQLGEDRASPSPTERAAPSPLTSAVTAASPDLAPSRSPRPRCEPPPGLRDDGEGSSTPGSARFGPGRSVRGGP